MSWLRHIKPMHPCASGLRQAHALQHLPPRVALARMTQQAVWLLGEVDPDWYDLVLRERCGCYEGRACDVYERAAAALVRTRWWIERFECVPANPPLIGWKAVADDTP